MSKKTSEKLVPLVFYTKMTDTIKEYLLEQFQKLVVFEIG